MRLLYLQIWNLCLSILKYSNRPPLTTQADMVRETKSGSGANDIERDAS
jgi:hypothetical protein